MITGWKKALWGVVIMLLLASAAWLGWLYHRVSLPLATYQPPPLRVVIADPSSRRRAPADARNHARRDYGPLATFLEMRLHRPVELLYRDDPGDSLHAGGPGPDLIVGKASIVSREAADANKTVRLLARLTNRDGETGVAGLFVVRQADPARIIGDLADHQILFGPPRDEERHGAALAALAEWGVTPVPPFSTVADPGTALRAVIKGDADAAVISDYDASLLEADKTAKRGTLRVVGRTAPVPFIAVFATARISPSAEQAVLEALLSVSGNPALLEALDSSDGFVEWDVKPAAKTPVPVPRAITEWADWRGPGRTGISADLPDQLPDGVKFLWRRGLTGPGLSGVAATTRHVIVADKSEQNDRDIWRCLDADTGKELWTVAYSAPGQMEFTNAPRATPVVHGDLVYLLGAFGDLHCVNVYGSGIVWRRNIVEDFNAPLPPWGMCSTPLIAGDHLIVNPGARLASLVALDLETGAVIWKTPGEPAAYSSLILGTFGGVRQIVGYDATSLGGWDPNTGQRLWTLRPAKKGDYNVPTPIDINGRLLVATENNGTRLYGFDTSGRIVPTPLAANPALAPDTSTPVVIEELVFGCFRGLFCLTLCDLETQYSVEDDPAFRNYAAFLAGNGHVLAITVGGELVLWQASPDGFAPISRLQVFTGTEVWSLPALVGDRLYLRSMKEIACILLK